MSHQVLDLADRLLTFSAKVIRLLDYMPSTKAAKEISDQLIRSAMSVGANYEEARGADSRADFCHKLQIAFKEMREARYWLCLTEKSGLIVDPAAQLQWLVNEATQLRSILAKAVATARGKAKKQSADFFDIHETR